MAQSKEFKRCVAKAFAHELRAARLAAGLQTYQLDTRAGLAERHTDRMETGENDIHISTLLLVCDALRIRAGDFVERIDARVRAGR